MRRPLSDAEVFGAGGGAVAAMAVAGILGSSRAVVSQANAGLVLVLVVIAAAAIGGRFAGVATALAAAVSFDFFLTKPYQSLAIKSGEEVLTTLLLLAAGLAVGQLARSRGDARSTARAGHDQVASLHRMAAATSGKDAMDALIRTAEDELVQVLRLERCTFSLLPPDPPLPELDATGRMPGRLLHLGDGFALPPEGLVLPARNGGSVVGWLVCVPPARGVGVSLDRRRAALVIAAQLGAALGHQQAGAA
ncbi:MAG: DUF4118 domain-containing protein [Acidimicrobiales bacterium]